MRELLPSLLLFILSVLLPGARSGAEVCTMDAVPAATLLVPYFAVDLENPDGFNTLFSVNNGTAAPVLAHVTFWTDYSIPTIDFTLYLTGYDVQTINLLDVFTNGRLPQTAPDDALSNRGAFSDAHVVFPGCGEGLPTGNIPSTLRDDLLIPAHTGQPVPFGDFDGDCLGADYADSVARGYITIDHVTQCSIDFPDTPGYFSGIAGFGNVLWGDVFWVDPPNDFAQGETLVHVEACNAGNDGDDACVGGQVQSADNYTFYGRYVAWSGSDRREPLGNVFATRYVSDFGPFDGSQLLCWRDAKFAADPFVCGTVPSGFPLVQEETVIFDEDENLALIPEADISPSLEPILVCPRETQLVEAGAVNLPVQYPFGWLFLNLNQDNANQAGNAPPEVSQAYVAVLMSASSRFSVSYDAMQLANSCQGLSILQDETGTTITDVGGGG